MKRSICHIGSNVLSSIGISLIHMFRLAQYTATRNIAMNRAEYLRVMGITRPNPRPISTTPVSNTQNVGSPSTSGTIGSNHFVSVKCAIPTLTKSKPRSLTKQSLPIRHYSLVVSFNNGLFDGSKFAKFSAEGRSTCQLLVL